MCTNSRRGKKQNHTITVTVLVNKEERMYTHLYIKRKIDVNFCDIKLESFMSKVVNIHNYDYNIMGNLIEGIYITS